MVRSRPGNGMVVICAIIGLASSPPSVADEIAIYESLSDVAIGRVFLTPQQRLYLDSRPVPVPRSVTELPTVEPVERKKNPAGYIISSTGRSSVWSQRGFVSSNEPGRTEFPGDIKVIRREASEPSDQGHNEERVPVSDVKENVDNDAP